jgi:drug/metabolite transporter (DMT)-like permease
VTAPPRAALPVLAVATTLVLWASAFVAIRHLGHDFSPGALTVGRLAVASALLGAYSAQRGLVRPSSADWWRLLVIGALWYAVYNLALNEGEQRVDAGTAALLIQFAPVVLAVLAAVFLGERFNRELGIGLVVALVGVALITLSSSADSERDVLGVVLCLVAAVSYAISLTVQKPLMSRLPAAQVTWLSCTIGLVLCLPFVGDLARQVGEAPASSTAWLVYLGVFPTAVAFTTYAYALGHMDASRLGVTTYLVPVITIALAWALLGEVPPPLAYAGGALAMVGVALARRRPRVREVTLHGVQT